jgi:hypothetical protein
VTQTEEQDCKSTIPTSFAPKIFKANHLHPLPIMDRGEVGVTRFQQSVFKITEISTILKCISLGSNIYYTDRLGILG